MLEFDRMQVKDGGGKRKETRYFLDWMRVEVLERADVARKASDMLRAVAQKSPEVYAYYSTPQSAPWHTEGITVDVHIRRILSVVHAIVDGADLFHVEEFSREKSLFHGLHDLQETIREHAGFFLAYAIAHDIAKPEVAMIEAARGSKGEAEGFFVRKQGAVEKPSDEAERQHFLKLFRGFLAKQKKDVDVERSVADFFDAYELQVHYPKHDRVGASSQFTPVRLLLAEEFHLSPEHVDLLRLLTKRHMDTMGYFMHGPDASKYSLLTALAAKDGYDGQEYVDFALAALFIDVVAGCLVYEHGDFSAQLQPVFDFLHSEAEVHTGRVERFDARLAERKQKQRKRAFEQAGLSGDALYTLLQIPFGPGRAEVKAVVERYVDGIGDLRGFEYAAEEMEKRVEVARALLREVDEG